LASFKFLQKLGCYKPTPPPLMMNLAPEIQTGWKRCLEILPSATFSEVSKIFTRYS
jgi:hypothetical protein